MVGEVRSRSLKALRRTWPSIDIFLPSIASLKIVGDLVKPNSFMAKQPDPFCLALFVQSGFSGLPYARRNLPSRRDHLASKIPFLVEVRRCYLGCNCTRNLSE